MPNDDLTVCVRELSWDVDQDTIRGDFEKCGAIDRLNMPKDDNGYLKGVAFIQYADEAGMKKALEYHGCKYHGWELVVHK
ncbi:unnamed protein product, partial [Prorocentrum cordatum]